MNLLFNLAAPPDLNYSIPKPSGKVHNGQTSFSARLFEIGAAQIMAALASTSFVFSLCKQLNRIPYGFKSALATLALLLLPYCISQAQTSLSPDSAFQAIFENIQGTPLTLAQAKESAMKNAASLLMAEASYRASRGSARSEKGAFDPELFFSLNYLDREEPTASFFSGAPILHTKQTMSRSGLRMELPIGTNVELALNTIRLESNSDFAFLNPEFDAFGSLSIRQPLLRGFNVSARKKLNQTKQELAAEEARYEQQLVTTIADIERAYWDLYAAQYEYAVQALSQNRAESFSRETELRANAGLVGPNQVASARTFLAEQELSLLDHEEQLDRRSDQLSTLMGIRPNTGMVRFIPVDNPPRNFDVERVDILVERALKSNRNLRALGHNVAARRSLADAASWEAWPSVDLVGSLDGSGLSGSPQAVVFGDDTLLTTRGGNFADAINQAAKRDYPGWSIGLEVNFPIGMRTGLGEKDRLKAEVDFARQLYTEGSRLLEEQVRATYRELAHGEGRLSAANEGVNAAQEQVRIGLIEFQNGRSTAFELVRLAEDLAVAQSRYSDSLVRTAKAAVTLRQLISDKSLLTTAQ
jgi:outer membrane protein TolC